MQAAVGILLVFFGFYIFGSPEYAGMHNIGIAFMVGGVITFIAQKKGAL